MTIFYILFSFLFAGKLVTNAVASPINISSACGKNSMVKCEYNISTSVKLMDNTMAIFSYKIASVDKTEAKPFLNYVDNFESTSTSYEIKLKQRVFYSAAREIYLNAGYKGKFNVSDVLYFSDYNGIYSTILLGASYIFKDIIAIEANYNFMNFYIKDNVNFLISGNIFDENSIKIDIGYKYHKDIKKTKDSERTIVVRDRITNNYRTLVYNIDDIYIGENNTFFINFATAINDTNSFNVHLFYSIKKTGEKSNGVGFGLTF